jgi:hypothetical protein
VPAPTLSSISPNTGLPVGDDFVQIVGANFNLKAQGSVKVTFGTAPAVRVGVVSPTLVFAVAPPGDPDAGVPPNVGKVDVKVENFDTNGVSQGSATLPKAYRYKRPRIDYPSDFSNHPALDLVRRALVAEFQRAVIKNVRSDVHPEYASAAAASDGTTDLASLPSLKIVGPRIRDDYMRSNPEPTVVDVGGGSFATMFAARAVELEYTIVGVGRDPTEAAHLWSECKRYFQHVDFLNVPIPSSKLGAETAALELEPDWTRLGEFRGKMTQQGVAQFNMVFHVRGLIPNADRKYWASEAVDTVVIATSQKAPDSPAPLEGVAVETLEVVLPGGADLRTTLVDLQDEIAELQRETPVSIPFSYATSSPLVLAQLLAGDIVDQVKVVVETGFDGAGAAIVLGTTQDPNLVFGPGDIFPGFVGDYESEQDFKIAQSTALVLTITSAGSTRGSGFVLVRLRK